jgi:integrase
MSVTVTLKYLSELGGDRWEYRRRVPESCKAAVGKTEWKRVFIARNAGGIAHGHAKVDAEFLAEMKAALLGATPKPSSVSPRRAFEVALERAEGLIAGTLGLDDDEARAVVADNIAADYPLDPEDGSPVGISRDDALTIKALMNPVKGVPGVSLEDARELYLKERIGAGEDPRRQEARKRLAKIFVRAGAAGLPASTLLVDLTRSHARDVRDHMLTYDKAGGGKIAAGSVKRDIAMMKTVVGHAIREFDLIKNAKNPFEELEIKGISGGEDEVSAQEKKESLPLAVVAGMSAKLEGDLRVIWGLLEGTGCRLAEIIGLRVEDVSNLEGAIPHIIIRPNPVRRLKNLSSRRSVPLFGDALRAALEALSVIDSGDTCFPAMPAHGALTRPLRCL